MLTRRSRLSEVLEHPLGRDIARILMRQLGWWHSWTKVFGFVRIGWLDRVLGKPLVDTLLNLLQRGPDQIAPGEDAPAWWKEAVFYQIWPRSFADSNGDGVGDLRGVIAHLDDLVDLGVDCVWLSPIFDSPNEDTGYDISDYRDIMAEMGTLADAEELIAACHERGMRIILDLVANHTSVRHPWARAAIDDPESEYGDYYFLRKGDAPPNNWVSFFSGSAWRRVGEGDRERWMLHLFAPGQVDLNWDNPTVRRAIADIVHFWQDKGVDGFRLDVVNFISKEAGLPDGDDFIGDLLEYRGIEQFYYGPHLHEYVAGLRRDGFTRRAEPASTVRERRPDGTLVGPLPADPVGVMVGEAVGLGVEAGKLVTRSNRGELDLIFNFDGLDNVGKVRWDHYRFDLDDLKEHLVYSLGRLEAGDWFTLFTDNHDRPRLISRIAAGDERDPVVRTALGKLLATMVLTLRGTPFLYQGQEIGAVNQPFRTVDDLRDVESLNRYAALREAGKTHPQAWAQIISGARDHARVPVRWTREGGFTTGEPWMPGLDDAPGFTLEEQRVDPDSIWTWTRDLIVLRRQNPALVYGDIVFHLPKRRGYFAWTRGDEFFIEANLTGKPRKRPKPPFETDVVMGGPRGPVMRPYEAIISRRVH